MKILVVDDDARLADTVKSSLVAHAHSVDVSNDGTDGAFLAKSYDYDAIVLDYSLPRKDGLTICREIRSAGKTTPIVFISNTTDIETKVAAFRNGADDYVVKPFSLDELHARLDAVARRAPAMKPTTLSLADLTLDPATNAVKRGSRVIHLTRKEFHLLEYLLRNAGVIMSRAQIMEHIWTADSNPFSNAIEAHMRNLRKKLDQGREPNLIMNIPGRGYLIDTPDKLARL